MKYGKNLEDDRYEIPKSTTRFPLSLYFVLHDWSCELGTSDHIFRSYGIEMLGRAD